jgi:hypothetical protein
MKTVQTQPVYPQDLDFGEIWTALEETNRMVKELSVTQRETARIVIKNAQQIGELGGHFNDMAEHTVIRLC